MPGFAGGAKQYAPTDYVCPPAHGAVFSSFGARIDLTQQSVTNLDAVAVDMPRFAASEVTLITAAAAGTFSLEIGTRLPMVITIPQNTFLTLRGAFTAITTVTGGVTPQVVAVWQQPG